MQLSMRPFRLTLASLVALSTPIQAQAKTFKTQFLKFEIPANWSCSQEEIDWICQPDNTAERSEAMIVVVTKAVNEIDDTFPKYEETLKAKRAMRDLLGNAYQSDVKYVRTRDIKGQKWIDSLHLGSEIPGFYSRYVASIKEQVAGLITYSVSESVYPKYAAMMDQMIDTVEIFFDPKAFQEAMKAGPSGILGVPRRGGGKFTAAKVENATAPTAPTPKTDPSQIVGGLILVGAVGYFIWKKKQQG